MNNNKTKNMSITDISTINDINQEVFQKMINNNNENYYNIIKFTKYINKTVATTKLCSSYSPVNSPVHSPVHSLSPVHSPFNSLSPVNSLSPFNSLSPYSKYKMKKPIALKKPIIFYKHKSPLSSPYSINKLFKNPS